MRKRCNDIGIILAGALFSALALGVLTNFASAAGTVPIATIEDAIGVLEFSDQDGGLYTQDGKPRVDALEILLGEDISAAERDQAWKLYRAPKVEAVAVDTSHLERRIATLTSERDAARSANQSIRDQASREIREAWSNARASKAKYDGLMDGAETDRRAARALKAKAADLRDEAKKVMREAKARERGAGPSSSRDCRAALREVVNADWSWTGNLKTDESDVNAARTACLE